MDNIPVSAQDSAALFAEMFAETTFDRLPVAAVDAAKKCTLDTLAVMCAAAGSTPALGKAVKLAVGMGGREEATIFGASAKVPAMMAAFANGATVHYLDYDDIEYDSTYHPSGAVVPAVLALAERQGNVGGRELLTAVALGQDIGIRMARAIPLQRRPPWHRSVVVATFAAAAAAARILGLDRDGIVDALGHALNLAAGSLELRWGAEAEIGGMYVAYSAKAGVFAALMAEAGIAGVKNVFDGPAGFFNLYFEGKCDRERLLSGLGRDFTGVDCALKPWPACAATNTYILATLNALQEHAIAPEDIERIEVFVGDYAGKLCEPLESRRKPASAPDAKFSLPYSVAAAAVRGGLRIGDFNERSLTDPRILALAAKVVPVADSDYDIRTSIPPGAVRIQTRDGRSIFRREALPHGHPSKPLSWDEVNAKALDCFAQGDPARGAEIVALCRDLDQIDDLRPLFALLSSR